MGGAGHAAAFSLSPCAPGEEAVAGCAWAASAGHTQTTEITHAAGAFCFFVRAGHGASCTRESGKNAARS